MKTFLVFENKKGSKLPKEFQKHDVRNRKT